MNRKDLNLIIDAHSHYSNRPNQILGESELAIAFGSTTLPRLWRLGPSAASRSMGFALLVGLPGFIVDLLGSLPGIGFSSTLMSSIFAPSRYGDCDCLMPRPVRSALPAAPLPALCAFVLVRGSFELAPSLPAFAEVVNFTLAPLSLGFTMLACLYAG